ncbi:alpha-galactosidase [Anaerotaenia torta]|uniref:hypothetical protein n=1 Tax=Anaerotaenia torta TaxID=433293 RepID=UPI003D223157
MRKTTDISINRLPDYVLLQTDSGWHRARTENKATVFAVPGAGVSVDRTQDGLRIELSAIQPVKRIIFRWDAVIGEEARLLGDAWERGYGDLEWRSRNPERIMPWYFYLADRESLYGIGIKTGANALCFWQTGNSDISLHMDVRCGSFGVELKDTLEVATVVFRKEEGGQVFDFAGRFCGRMCDNGIFPSEPVYGGNNWYNAYGDSSEEQILEDSARIARYARGNANRPFMVIDAGWQACGINEDIAAGGPYGKGNYRFPDMKRLAQRMKDTGVRPGLWCRPSRTLQSLPKDYYLFPAVLDPTVPQVLELIRGDMERFVGWGYELIKHDFSTYDYFDRQWGFQMGGKITTNREYRFADRSKTTAQALKLFYQAVCEGGKGAYIIGCNTMGHLAAGYVHLQRTGDDTSGQNWERTRKMGVNTLAFRMPQHNRFYHVDGDCVGITKQIPWEKNRQWLELLAKSGTPLFVSLDQSMATEEVEAAITEAFRYAAVPHAPASPLDWFGTTVPEYWLIGDEAIRYEWDDKLKTESYVD